MRYSNRFNNPKILALLLSCSSFNAQAEMIDVSIRPKQPSEFSISKGERKEIQYKIQNHSSTPNILLIDPIVGITQNQPCELPAYGSCLVTLHIDGSKINGDLIGWPLLCEKIDKNNCVHLNQSGILNIHLKNKPFIKNTFIITPSSTENGELSLTAPQVASYGSTILFTAKPNPGFGVSHWIVDGEVVQNGGYSYHMQNIKSNHSIEVTFEMATLTPSVKQMVLSTRDVRFYPNLPGKSRTIQIRNNGSIPAVGLNVTTDNLPPGTHISSNTCVGTLNQGDICDITITPGMDASLNKEHQYCNIKPGSEPVPSKLLVSSENASPITVPILVLSYGCIYQGGFLFSINDDTPRDESIGGKIAGLKDYTSTMRWGPHFPDVGGINELSKKGDKSCEGKIDGECNTARIINSGFPLVAAQICVDSDAGNFKDWYLPSICELGRFKGLGNDPGCPQGNNMYDNLYGLAIGNFNHDIAYWSSTEYSENPRSQAWLIFYPHVHTDIVQKTYAAQIRCARNLTP